MSKQVDKQIFKWVMIELGAYPKYNLTYDEYSIIKDISLDIILELHGLEVYDTEYDMSGLDRSKTPKSKITQFQHL